jgi:hypothetical protein
MIHNGIVVRNYLVAELVRFASEYHGHVFLVRCHGYGCGAAPPLHRAVAHDGRRAQNALRNRGRKREGKGRGKILARERGWLEDKLFTSQRKGNRQNEEKAPPRRMACFTFLHSRFIRDDYYSTC